MHTASSPFIFIGVDAGGTRTRAVCISSGGEILGYGVSGPANHASGAFATAKRSIEEAIRQALSSHSDGCGAELRGVHIGSAGLERPGSEREARKLLSGIVSAAHVSLDTDAYAAWAGGLRCRAGIVLISGTGSICLGVNELGERGRAGGWGWRVGDEGSAYSIAVQAIRAALQTADRRRQDIILWKALRQFVGVQNTSSSWSLDQEGEQVRAWLSKRRTPSEIAQFAPWVSTVAQNGCHTSRNILKKAGMELASLVRGVLSQIKFSEPLLVARVGSVLENNGFINKAFIQEMRQVSPLPTLITPAYPPEIGAALLAMRACDHPLTQDLFLRLDSELTLKFDQKYLATANNRGVHYGS